MATIVKTFDLYNTQVNIPGYTISTYSTEFQLASAYRFTQNSSNPIGSQIDFFNYLGGLVNQNPVFNLDIKLTDLPYLWQRYWWEMAMFYSHPIVLNTILVTSPSYYQPFSESVGTLAYLSRVNTKQNTNTKPYNPLTESLVIPRVSSDIDGFYSIVNNMFLTSINNIGPNSATDVNNVNGNIVMPDTDLSRRISSVLSLTASINSLYPKIMNFLPFNNTVIGNLITPPLWSTTTNVEDVIISVDILGNSITDIVDLTTDSLRAT